MPLSLSIPTTWREVDIRSVSSSSPPSQLSFKVDDGSRRHDMTRYEATRRDRTRTAAPHHVQMQPQRQVSLHLTSQQLQTHALLQKLHPTFQPKCQQSN